MIEQETFAGVPVFVDDVKDLHQTGTKTYRTDQHYHVTVQTDGNAQGIEVKWSRLS